MKVIDLYNRAALLKLASKIMRLTLNIIIFPNLKSENGENKKTGKIIVGKYGTKIGCRHSCKEAEEGKEESNR